VIRHDVSNAKKFGADDFLVGTCRVAVINGLAQFSQWFSFPALRNAFGDTGVFVAGETEADEPFTVNVLR
jgi:hypothetical protein